MIGMVIGVPVFAIFAKILYEKTEDKIAKNSEIADVQAAESDPKDAAETGDPSSDEGGSGVDKR